MTLSVAPPTLPGGLVDNPRLDQWVAFPARGQVIVRTGKVEIGQGVLTALRQIVGQHGILLRLRHRVIRRLILETRHNRVQIPKPRGITRIVYIEIELIFVRVINAGGRITRSSTRSILQRHPRLENTPKLNDAEEQEQEQDGGEAVSCCCACCVWQQGGFRQGT